ncbi:hypothetical protein OEZ77_26945, partial [Leclercia adecarboxylata]|uniref:hypothetical protein n=1 Tax=Leclercia adecarboxylata TaxID=83655 RepID=UPI00234CF7FC
PRASNDRFVHLRATHGGVEQRHIESKGRPALSVSVAVLIQSVTKFRRSAVNINLHTECLNVRNFDRGN